MRGAIHYFKVILFIIFQLGVKGFVHKMYIGVLMAVKYPSFFLGLPKKESKDLDCFSAISIRN